MTLSEIMLYLQQHSKEGMIASVCVVVIGYLLISIILLIISRKTGMNTAISAFIPIMNLFIIPVMLVIILKSKIKAKKDLRSNPKDILLDSEEIFF